MPKAWYPTRCLAEDEKKGVNQLSLIKICIKLVDKKIWWEGVLGQSDEKSCQKLTEVAKMLLVHLGGM